jgi:hypothetical protein
MTAYRLPLPTRRPAVSGRGQPLGLSLARARRPSFDSAPGPAPGAPKGRPQAMNATCDA